MPFDIGNFNLDVKALQTRAKGGIVTDGLVLHLDAAYKNSYPGGGTTWYDLSGNGNHGTMVNGPTFNSDNKGNISFDGTNDYISKTGINYTPYCIDIWFYNNDQINPDQISGNNYQQLLGMGNYPGGVTLGGWTSQATNETISFFGSNWTINGLSYIRDTITVGWHNLIINWNGSSYDMWLDGSQRTVYAASSYGHCTLHSRDSIFIGKEDGTKSYEFNGNISSLRIYNRSLSPDEVWQNYESTKNRFTWEQESIVTDGLILHLDAGNTSSYPGSGTTWYDLSGNGYNGTLTNGGSFSSNGGGSILLDGTNDYIYVPIDLRNGNYTIFGAARYVSIGGRTFSANNNNWLMGHWSSSTTKHYAQGWVTDTSSTENSDTNWRIYTATRSSDTWSFYVNNSLDTSNTGGSQGPYNFSIGRYGPGSSEYSNSNIAFLIVYNRVLTASEMTQNYNVLKNRFGL